ncbi:hypothetical protein [Acinetobacter sp. ANC 4218]|uniref:hypothetical protein n=1 Tax=Acinetobacter sp. ANC 4218 TaxID=1977880 RepID=UPI002075C627|nr:hypothetical protein [Acinetobacter sp. ANC 4218]
MIGITSKGELISVEVGQRPKGLLTGILITDPEHLTEENLAKIKLRFHGPDGQLNQYRCLDALHIDQDQIDLKGDESTLELQKSDLPDLSTHQFGVKSRIREHKEALGRLLQYLSKKLQS